MSPQRRCVPPVLPAVPATLWLLHRLLPHPAGLDVRPPHSQASPLSTAQQFDSPQLPEPMFDRRPWACAGISGRLVAPCGWSRCGLQFVCVCPSSSSDVSVLLLPRLHPILCRGVGLGVQLTGRNVRSGLSGTGHDRAHRWRATVVLVVDRWGFGGACSAGTVDGPGRRRVRRCGRVRPGRTVAAVATTGAAVGGSSVADAHDCRAVPGCERSGTG